MTKITKSSILLSEDFYSIQGEGITTGYPSYFIRLANCNLTCGATPKFVNKFKKEERDDTPGSFRGDLEAEGKATWTCDSIPEWAKGVNVDYNHLINRWIEQDILKDISSGLIHIIGQVVNHVSQCTKKLLMGSCNILKHIVSKMIYHLLHIVRWKLMVLLL